MKNFALWVNKNLYQTLSKLRNIGFFSETLYELFSNVSTELCSSIKISERVFPNINGKRPWKTVEVYNISKWMIVIEWITEIEK